MPEALWRMLVPGVVLGLATGTWWALAVALVVAVPIVTVPDIHDETSDFEWILFYATAGALSIGLGVGITQLAGLLSRKRGGAGASERTGELGEDGQVGVKLDALDATDAERQ